jgi:acetylornithine deacetylase
MAAMAIDRQFTIETLRDTLRIDSRNPGLESDAPGEWELAHHVQRLVEGLGWEAQLHDLRQRRANVVATRRGTGLGRSMMINVHLDTVGVAGMDDPFSGRIENGRIYGRGAQDTKGGLAAVLGAARALAEDGVCLKGDLVLAFVADEEHESLGTARLVESVRTEAAIVIEPTDLDVCVAHRGFGIFRIRTRGRTAHGGRPDVGIDANLHMGQVLAQLERLRRQWQNAEGHPLLGPPSLHVPKIEGGRHLFVYADACTADVECRVVPGQSQDQVQSTLQDILDGLAGEFDDFDASVEPVMWRGPYQIDVERPLVQTVLTAARSVHPQAKTIGHSWWEDSALLGEAGIEAVVLGPRGGGLHTEREWADLDSVVQLAEILYESVRTWCGTPDEGDTT